jgi:hypothetical protein
MCPATCVNTTQPPSFRKPDFSLSHLIEVGHRLVREQQRVDDMKLANEYNRALQLQPTIDNGDSNELKTPFYRVDSTRPW